MRSLRWTAVAGAAFWRHGATSKPTLTTPMLICRCKAPCWRDELMSRRSSRGWRCFDHKLAGSSRRPDAQSRTVCCSCAGCSRRWPDCTLAVDFPKTGGLREPPAFRLCPSGYHPYHVCGIHRAHTFAGILCRPRPVQYVRPMVREAHRCDRRAVFWESRARAAAREPRLIFKKRASATAAPGC